MSAPIPDAASEGGNTGSAGAVSLSWNHTVGASLANSAIVATGQVSNASGSDISNVQWDAAVTPVAFTKFGSIIDSAGFAHAAQWLLKSPASGTKQVKITAAASAQISGGAASFSNVDQTTPWNPAGPQTNTGSTSPQPSLVVTSGVNELAIASVADDENTTNDALTVSASSGTATTINNDSIGVGLLSGRGDYAPGASSVTFTYAGAHAGDTTWAVIGGSLRGAPSGGGIRLTRFKPGRHGPGKRGPFLDARRNAAYATSTGAQSNTISLAGTVGSSGALTNFTAAPKTGTLASAGALAKLVQATKTGATASSGALAKQAAKTVAGSAATSGGLVKLASKILGGTVSSSGALAVIRAVLIALGGTVTSAGSLVRQTGKALTGATSSAGALAKRIAKPLGGAIPSAGSLARRTAKALAGSVASSGVASILRVALLALGGSMAAAGALTRRTAKGVAGSAGSLGTLARRTAKQLAGLVAPAGALRKSIARVFGGILSAAASLVTKVAGFVAPLYPPGRFTPDDVAAKFTAATSTAAFHANDVTAAAAIDAVTPSFAPDVIAATFTPSLASDP